MAFTDADIRALVEAGQYSDPAAADYLSKVLIERRDKIGRAYFQKVLALDNVHVTGSELRFDDLLVKHGFSAPREYAISWSRFNNEDDIHENLTAENTFRLPREWDNAAAGSYYAAMIRAKSDETKTVRVYLRKRDGEAQVVGIERAW
jgi:hypothetical protein